MASKAQALRSSAHDLHVDRPDQIRNLVLVGPGDAGKTTLIETLLARAGAIPRAGSVREGTAVCDQDESEITHVRSISVAVAPLVQDGMKVNLIDTPGYADFVGELRAGLRAADSALFVIAANEEVDHATVALWRECQEVGMPRAVVITKLDQQRADYESVLAQLQAAFGENVLPLYVPVRAAGRGGDVTELAGLLSPTRHADDALRATLIEAVIEESEDETLMDRYVAGEEIAESVLLADLEKAVARGKFHPVIPVCSVTGVGCAELLSLTTRAFPAPTERPAPPVFTPAGAAADPISADPDGPLVAEIFRTATDPYVGRVSLVRVFSGTLTGEMPVHVSGHAASFGIATSATEHDEDERVGGLAHAFGSAQVPTERIVAGDIGAVGRLVRAQTGDTLSSVERPVVLQPWNMPEPLLPVAVGARSKVDEDKLSQALSRVAAEDPSLRVINDPETHQLVLWCMGETHADVVLERLEARFGVSVDQVPLLIPLRETFGGAAVGKGRHVKQSGGHGQYAVCDLEVEPLAQGAGFEFVDKVVGGAVPRQYIPSVEKGVLAQMERGLRLGYPVVDVRVTLLDGKAHAVDSSDMAFQMAGGSALRDAAERAQVTLLEPVDTVEVVVPDDVVGPTMSDLSARRGRLLGSEQLESGRTLVRAEVPQTELVRYAVELRAATHGAGSFERAFARYEAMPEQVARAATPA